MSLQWVQGKQVGTGVFPSVGTRKGEGFET
jgi:hypothetical protein